MELQEGEGCCGGGDHHHNNINPHLLGPMNWTATVMVHLKFTIPDRKDCPKTIKVMVIWRCQDPNR